MIKKITLKLVLILLILNFTACFDSDDEDDKYSDKNYPKLHVKSPEWEEQIIYFVLTDRFNDGDVTNNSQGLGEYNPNHLDYYSGGDLKGVIDKIDYIKNLGMTSVWITPPVANQWINPLINVTGYHGYWGRHFKMVDEHLGTLDTYKNLSNTLHENNMYLIQDIVPNHTANFFTYNGSVYDANDPSKGFRFLEGSMPSTAPTQYPFSMNDYHNEEHRQAGIYHYTPEIYDYTDPYQELNYQMGDLDDLNTANPIVRDALKDSYSYWIKEVGVDAFRVDTVKFIEHEFWNDFVHADNGILKEAQKSGREDFFMFGEVYEESMPYSDNGEKKVVSYLGTSDKPELPAVLNFPMHTTIMEVFGLGKATDYLTYRISIAMDTNYFPNPYRTPVFIDNHDISRFRSKASLEGTKQALMFLLTIPGIPIIYQGTEQEFTEQRGAMFKGGYKSNGKDHFDQNSEMYKYIQSLANIRKSDKIFTRGDIKVIKDNNKGAGILAYERIYEGNKVLVLFNTSDNDILLNNLKTDFTEGKKLEKLISLNDNNDYIATGKNGEITLELNKRAGMILKETNESVDIDTNLYAIEITSDLTKLFESDFVISGILSETIKDLEIVIDGDLKNTIPCVIKNDVEWEAYINIDRFEAGEEKHKIIVYSREKKFATDDYEISTVYNPNQIVKNIIDPENDDKGPEGKYTLPTDASFGGQMDILNTKVIASGTKLEIILTMKEITTTWNPKHGFDHVVFNVFIDLNNNSGCKYLPKLNSNSPEGFEWDYYLFLDGWKIGYYSLENADKDNYGKAVTPTPEIFVDKDRNEIKLVFGKATIGNPENIEGAKIYITTWDYDGNTSELRPLTQEGGAYSFGGGDGTKDSLIADSTEIIVIE